jgi:hypothetical protein
MTDITPRTGQAEFPLSKEEFTTRYRARFEDPAFSNSQNGIDQ